MNYKYINAVTLYEAANYAEAFPIFQTLAEQGHAQAQYYSELFSERLKKMTNPAAERAGYRRS
jgi:TPR repeat protein